MVFASSRDALRRSLVGVALEIQGTDYSEVAHEIGELEFSLFSF
jgi:cofilin